VGQKCPIIGDSGTRMCIDQPAADDNSVPGVEARCGLSRALTCGVESGVVE
jgi:hypothetical protein